MHVKLNVVKLFNRLSLLANQNSETPAATSTATTITSMSNGIHNNLIDDVDSECKKTNGISATTADVKHNQKFIISSNFNIHEDDLSRIDVKSLVRISLYFALKKLYQPNHTYTHTHKSTNKKNDKLIGRNSLPSSSLLINRISLP